MTTLFEDQEAYRQNRRFSPEFRGLAENERIRLLFAQCSLGH